MERGLKRAKIFITAETKRLLKDCFANLLYGQVPFEIWLDIVWKMSLKTIFTIATSSKAFKELVERHLKRDMRFALLCRREDQIPVAKKCLQTCAEDGDPLAILHLGLSVKWGGWGLSSKFIRDDAKTWLKIAADSGNLHAAMIMYSFGDTDYNVFIHNSFKSKDPLRLAFFSILLGTYNTPTLDAHLMVEFEKNIDKTDEFMQVYLGSMSNNRRTKIYWLQKAADQGNFTASEQLSFTFSAREKDEVALFEKYSYKARIQQNL
jgi:hypothetical protein